MSHRAAHLETPRREAHCDVMAACDPMYRGGDIESTKDPRIKLCHAEIAFPPPLKWRDFVSNSRPGPSAPIKVTKQLMCHCFCHWRLSSSETATPTATPTATHELI